MKKNILVLSLMVIIVFSVIIISFRMPKAGLTGLATGSPTATPTPSPTPSQTPAPTPTPTPTEFGCCLFEDRCEDRAHPAECTREQGYENHWFGEKCSEAPGCKMGCCFYYDLEEHNAGTCDQRPRMICMLLNAGKQKIFYENTDCKNVKECNYRYGCCIWTENTLLTATSTEKEVCKTKNDPIFIEGDNCPGHLCFNVDNCANKGKPFCSEIGTYGLGVYRYDCDNSIRACKEILVERCDYACDTQKAECIPQPSASAAPILEKKEEITPERVIQIQEIYLSKGMNFVSLIYKPDSNNINDIFAGKLKGGNSAAEADVIWKLIPGEEDYEYEMAWQVGTGKLMNSNTGQLSDMTLDVGEGFIIENKHEERTIQVQGYEIDEARIKIKRGHNHIGIPFEGYTAKSLFDSLLLRNNVNCEISNWQQSTKKWQPTYPDMNFDIEPGAAYLFDNCDESVTLEIKKQETKKVSEVAEEELEEKIGTKAINKIWEFIKRIFS